MDRLYNLPLDKVIIDDKFWSKRIDIARNISIDYMWRALNDEIPSIPKSGAINNFKIAAKLLEGDFIGYPFQDSDLYKWIEAASYSLNTKKDIDLLKKVQYSISLIEKAQCSNGYINTYITINKIEPFSDLCSLHELYCAGHLIEAAVAYKNATSSDDLLNIACRFSDLLYDVFGYEEGKKRGYPGHQEIELALFKLYKTCGKEKYLNLAKFFLDERGKKPYYYDEETRIRGKASFFDPKDHGPMVYSYQQSHMPVREQKEAIGHAVRCTYMLSGMIDVGGEIDDSLLLASRALYDNIVKTQMYITGGIGSMNDGEAFTFSYDLPNDHMYSETCASVALMMASKRLLNIDRNGFYGDILERVLYNAFLAGESLDGTKFFYVNPLEMWPKRSALRQDMKGVRATRKGWYGCACCPPNVLRTLLSLGQYIYSQDNINLYVNLFISSKAEFIIKDQVVKLTQVGSYPYDGKITFKLWLENPATFSLNIRIPGWSNSSSLFLNGENINLENMINLGFINITREFKDGDTIEINFPMKGEFIYPDTRIPYDSGKVAVMRGPLVYCNEEVDNGKELWNISLDTSKNLYENKEDDLLQGIVTLKTCGYKDELYTDNLYSKDPPKQKKIDVTFVPYYGWANRDEGEMQVWHRVKI